MESIRMSRNKDDDFEKLKKAELSCKVYCDCGCGRIFPKMKHTRDRLICNNCGKWIYKDEATRFKYEMKERLRNEKVIKKTN